MAKNFLQDDRPVKLAFTVPRNLLVGLLVSAAEGGSNYWATISVPPGQRSSNYDRIHVKDVEADKEPFEGIVTADDMVRGLQHLAMAKFPAAGKHLGDALSQNGDAITADVVLQMAIFGEVLYG